MTGKLRKLYTVFKEGQMDKRSYVRRMHDIHRMLWEYSDFIRGKNISSIKISEKCLTFTTKNGIVITCDQEDERSAPLEIINFGDYENIEMRMIRKFLNKNSVILDIGANIGWYSLNLSRYIPNGRIIAFEPIPHTFGYLKKNIKLNGAENIQAHNYGLSDKAEISHFYHNPKFAAAASLKNLHIDNKAVRVKCRVRRMDDFIFNLTQRIDLIKCDVEGAELYVMKGALETLKKTRPVLFVEMLRKWSAKFGYHPNDTIALLGNIGYYCYYAKRNKIARIAKVSEKTQSTNFYFLDPKKHAKFLKELS